MAVSQCPHCNNRTFELQLVEAAGAKFKHYFIQCSACGAPAGLVEYENIGGQLTTMGQFLNLLASDLRSGVADLRSRLADMEDRLKRIEARK